MLEPYSFLKSNECWNTNRIIANSTAINEHFLDFRNDQKIAKLGKNGKILSSIFHELVNEFRFLLSYVFRSFFLIILDIIQILQILYKKFSSNELVNEF